MSYTLASLVQKRVEQDSTPQFELPFLYEKETPPGLDGFPEQHEVCDIRLLAVPSAPPWTVLAEESLSSSPDWEVFQKDLDDTLGLQWLQEVYASPVKGSRSRKTRSVTRSQTGERLWPGSALEVSARPGASIQRLLHFSGLIARHLQSWYETSTQSISQRVRSLERPVKSAETWLAWYTRRLRDWVPLGVARSQQLLHGLQTQVVQWRAWEIEGTLTGPLLRPRSSEIPTRRRGSGAIWRRWQLEWQRWQRQRLEEYARQQLCHWEERIIILEEALRAAYQRTNYWQQELQRIQRQEPKRVPASTRLVCKC
jgi:hypothetical protein